MKLRFFLLIILFFPVFLYCKGRGEVPEDQLTPYFVLPYNTRSVPENPYHIQDPDILRFTGALFQGLTVPDPVSGEAAPGLAERWSYDPDALSFTFFLKESVWSNGEALTAEQVRESWKKALDPGNPSPYAWIAGEYIKGAREYISGSAPWDVVEIRLNSDNALEISLTRPAPYFPGSYPIRFSAFTLLFFSKKAGWIGNIRRNGL